MRIAYTRAMLSAALNGRLAGVEQRLHPQFKLLIPASVPEVPSEVLDPRATWQDKQAYDRTVSELTRRFETNFKQFEPYVGPEVKAAAIRAAA
jgi:phosphoenolpyruvate carboxykinase (ATP)